MNIPIPYLPRTRLSTGDLASVTPLALSKMAAFSFAPGADAGNDAAPGKSPPRELRGRYAPTAAFQPLFRVR